MSNSETQHVEICASCGKMLESHEAFCSQCGNKVAMQPGDWTPDSQAQALFSIQGNPAVENNTFGFSLTEMVLYTTYTYKGSVTFTSSKEAEGTMNVYGDDYRFTATPAAE